MKDSTTKQRKARFRLYAQLLATCRYPFYSKCASLGRSKSDPIAFAAFTPDGFMLTHKEIDTLIFVLRRYYDHTPAEYIQSFNVEAEAHVRATDHRCGGRYVEEYLREFYAPRKVKSKKYPSQSFRFRRGRLCELQGFKCHYCGCKIDINSSHLEHKTPKKLGGRYTKDNLVASCIPCNRKKSDTPYNEFVAKIGGAK